jgi:GH15 family glucan-1,4-alpha-glucosidase
MTRRSPSKAASPYPPIGDYAIISDCHTAALVSSSASIDWCCFPRFDGGPAFGRLVDWERGGCWRIDPVLEDHRSSREYLDDTLVLATTFSAPGGECRLIDCFTMREGGADRPHRQLLRVVEGVRGSMELRTVIQPRFDYGGVKPWIRLHGPNLYTAIGGNDALVIGGDVDLEGADGHDLVATFAIQAGERVRFSASYAAPEEIDPDPPPLPTPEELDARLDETIAWWRGWAKQIRINQPYHSESVRSAMVLKALVYAPTGAMVAAPTTSLPESIGHGRNWDYRFSWIRDSQFTIRSLTELGCTGESDGFRRFVERSAAGSVESLQIMYGVGGERRLVEFELDLDGYRSSRPVRVGNAASQQQQLDVFGYLLDLAWRWHQRGHSPDDDYWRFLVSLVDRVLALWKQPDCGIWEMRGKPQHFVHSKVMCWAAVDRGIRLAKQCLRQAPLERWERAAAAIRRSVEAEGYDKERGIFVQSYGSQELDASLLLLPAFDFLAYDDERMVRTTDAIVEELDQGGLLLRYRAVDGLPGKEGVFIACTFWLSECFAYQGRLQQARDAFGRANATANDLGLFSEEFEPASATALGNFPQALTHLSHIAAAVALAQKLPSPSATASQGDLA